MRSSPTEWRDGVLHVVTCDPAVAVADVGDVFGAHTVEVALCTTSDFKRLLLTFYGWRGQPSQEELTRPVDRTLISAARLRVAEPVGLPSKPEIHRLYENIINGLLSRGPPPGLAAAAGTPVGLRPPSVPAARIPLYTQHGTLWPCSRP